MSDTYKGESWAKKVARYRLWKLAAQNVDLKSGPVLVLSSREAGDISVLKGLGVDPRQIIAVDTDRDAVAQARELHPDVTIQNIDASTAARRSKTPLVASYLDFCGPISAASMSTVADVVVATKLRGVVGVNVLKGRETGTPRRMLDPEYRAGQVARDILDLSPDQQSLDRCFKQVIYGGEKSDDEIEESWLETGMKLWDRDSTISHYISKLCKTRFCFGVGSVQYQSITADGKGVPMMTGLYHIYPVNRWNRKSSLNKIADEIMTACRLEMIEDVISGKIDLDDAELPPDRNRDIRVESSLSASKLAAAKILQDEENGPLLLNISKAQAAALKAHATMGTYEKAA